MRILTLGCIAVFLCVLSGCSGQRPQNQNKAVRQYSWQCLGAEDVICDLNKDGNHVE